MQTFRLQTVYNATQGGSTDGKEGMPTKMREFSYTSGTNETIAIPRHPTLRQRKPSFSLTH